MVLSGKNQKIKKVIKMMEAIAVPTSLFYTKNPAEIILYLMVGKVDPQMATKMMEAIAAPTQWDGFSSSIIYS